ncbi:hypothetical protein EMIT0194MI4_170067 [Pseudomonas sp. IT-194MI4]|jgi:hypothetical protein
MDDSFDEYEFDGEIVDSLGHGSSYYPDSSFPARMLRNAQYPAKHPAMGLCDLSAALLLRRQSLIPNP